MNLYITELGAVGDGVTSNTAIINEAIEKVHAAGGGQVIVPPGTFFSGSIVLKDNVHLYMESGSKIFGSGDPADYPNGALVFANHADNIGVEGHGIIEITQPFDEAKRPNVINMESCSNVTVRDVSLYDHGAAWVTLFSRCFNVTLDGIIIESRDCDNGDGLDFWGSTNVSISNCKIRAGDDAIGLKTGPDAACVNFMITNCVLNSNWAGVRIGPESWGDMRNITISNCVFNDCSDALKIQHVAECQMEDMVFSNLVMVNTCRALCMTYSPLIKHMTGDPNQYLGKMRRMRFSNIIAKNGGRAAHQRFHAEQMIIQGMPGAPIEDISFDNVQFICSGDGKVDELNGILAPDHSYYENFYPEFLPGDLRYGADNTHPAACMYINHASNLKFMNCVFNTIVPDERPAIIANDVHNMKFFMCSTNVEAGLLRYCDCEDVSAIACEGSVAPVTDAQEKQYKEFKAYQKHNLENVVNSNRYMCKFGSMTRALEVEHPTGTDVEVPAFVYRHEGGNTVYFNLGALMGSPRITVNGKDTFFWDRGTCPHYNDDRGSLVADISHAIVSGDNEIKVTLEGDLKEYISSKFEIYVSAE